MNDYYMDYFDLEILNCKLHIRPCLILEAFYDKICIRKYAFTTSHPAVRSFYAVNDNLNEDEQKILNSMDPGTIREMLIQP